MPGSVRVAARRSRWAIASVARSEGPPAPAEGGDRRVVTALFADLVDYVRMLAEHDPEDVRARVTSALMTMASAIERFEGTREKFIGDAVFAVFGWPRAHDDDAVRAALAALAIRSGLQEAAAGAEPLDVRIGIATGEVVAGASSIAIDGDLRLTGEAITTAARIQSMARAGEILLDDATLRAARGRLATDAAGRGRVARPVDRRPAPRAAGRGGRRAVDPVPGRQPGSARRPRRRARGDPRGARTGPADRPRGRTPHRVGDAGVGKTRLLQAVEGLAA